jgi:fructokinase
MSESKVPQIVAAGELLWDLLPGAARLGGAPANFAVFCARLGNRTALVSSVGDDDYGRAAGRLLVQPNLDLRKLQDNENHPTGTVKVTFSADNQPSYNIIPGVAWDFISLTPELVEAARAADAVCFGTLGQRHEVSRATIRSLLEATAPECVRVCDVNIRMPYCSPDVLRWSMAHATIIKVSDEELPQVFSFLDGLGLDRQIALTPETAARALLDNFPGCELVATTLGAQGSLLTGREGSFRHPGYPIKLVDTVGAGDAFTAGLLHAYLRGASLSQMAEVGNLCGSYVAGQQGATPPLSAELIDRIGALLGKTTTVGN